MPCRQKHGTCVARLARQITTACFVFGRKSCFVAEKKLIIIDQIVVMGKSMMFEMKITEMAKPPPMKQTMAWRSCFGLSRACRCQKMRHYRPAGATSSALIGDYVFLTD